MQAARSRFVSRAFITLVGAIAAAAGIAVTVFLLMRTPSSDTGFGPLLAVIAVVAILLGLGGQGIWNGIALIRIQRMHPEALVFLARREPSLAPDLPMYLHRRDLTVDVADKWVPAVITERGMAAWSAGPHPRELFVMPWSELGSVEVVDFTSIEGHARFGIAVDVQPFPSPLIVRVGYAMFGLQAAFDRAGTIAVADATRAKRPVAVTP